MFQIKTCKMDVTKEQFLPVLPSEHPSAPPLFACKTDATEVVSSEPMPWAPPGLENGNKTDSCLGQAQFGFCIQPNM